MGNTAWWKTDRAQAIFGILFGCLMVAVMVCAIAALSFWIDNRQQTVVSTKDIGRLDNLFFMDGGSDYRTRVDTEKGQFLVYGTLQAFKGSPLSLETRKNGDRMLYVVGDRMSCRKLVE